MEATLTKWGNSIGVRIPSQMASEIGFHAGSKVELRSHRNQIVIQPRYDLKEMYESYYHKPLSEITANDVGNSKEMDWGGDVGAEVID
ncbi:AbrB/MazE/SpoVT family DNA-binding domain-containing protein [Selenomonas sp.]|uniref:AbrB/MazE/SpoVT family DNA-binding domain-containing protein n=1 Tax=Selenomonas sp. TaxID=2053611 RepID=UPI0025FCCA14|nr:AbrB/MazE/SpoVT family DNA-binding domain-containing protein [Selenomonas sp.]MDY3296109.1 AbrB/MazE/SpoVT family DNA-binding domain-containing protein [Selenomonas sp.]MDY4415820.1 AbrB/MazE/SpoVT family DNA-binding domain-containing protein [Selenomonas sp.]